jgi:hypothetical protein
VKLVEGKTRFYACSHDLRASDGGEQWARIESQGRGSAAGTVHVSLGGVACSALDLEGWSRLALFLTRSSARSAGKVTRWDLAWDDYRGQVVADPQAAVDAYGLGGFRHRHGRPPGTNYAGDWGHRQRSRTFYVGSRSGGKLLRCYTKGLQKGMDPRWHRVEVEWRSRDRVIDPTRLLPAMWAPTFAGAFSWCSDLLAASGMAADGSAIATVKAKPPEDGAAALVRLGNVLAAQYGPQIAYWRGRLGDELFLNHMTRKGGSRVVRRLQSKPPNRGEISAALDVLVVRRSAGLHGSFVVPSAPLASPPALAPLPPSNRKPRRAGFRKVGRPRGSSGP